MRRATDLGRFAWLLRRYLAPHWPAVVLLLVASAIGTVLTAVFPVLMAPILDLALGGSATSPARVSGLTLGNLGATFFSWIGVRAVDDRFRAILWLCLAYVGVGVLKGWLDFGTYMLALWIRMRASTALQADLFRHILSLSMSFFTRHRTGELVSRLSNDTLAATHGLETIVGTLFSAPVLILFYGYLLATTSPRLVGAAAAAVILHYVVTRGIRGPVRRFMTDQFSLMAEVAARFQETLLSIRTVKSFGAEAFERGRLGRVLGDVVRVNVKRGAHKHIEEPARAIVNYVVEAGLILLAVSELMAGRLAAPTFFLFLYVGRAAVVQVGLISTAVTTVHGVLAATGRVWELFAVKPETVDGREPVSDLRDRIAFRDVSFSYGDEPVLSGMSFEIARGEMVALVGASGVGKSTVADLLLRFYDPVTGVVTLDGRDIRTLRQEDYRRLFGVVSQEALLFNTTIRDNIVYGREGLDEADVVRAAQVANAHDFIAELPDGYATVVADRGIRLSGGQRQRIAIARAVVGRPAILVLDEATSALDSESERVVWEAIDRAVQGTTALVIAHRLSTVLRADRIVVLSRGGVEAVGRHAELLDRSETYRHLHRLQFGDAGALERVR
ncbi:MAG TPA: ABC transporter ATP-binding protein [Candidatus Acidoferrum sp.]|nr:ABC transporter ATP-binding protein [Candidatus Acidoferrum sp.]